MKKVKSILFFPSGLIAAYDEENRQIDEIQKINYIAKILKEISEKYDIKDCEVIMTTGENLEKAWHYKKISDFVENQS